MKKSEPSNQELAEQNPFRKHIRDTVFERTTYGCRVYQIEGRDDSEKKKVCQACKRELPIEKYNKWVMLCCDECWEKIVQKYRVPEIK